MILRNQPAECSKELKMANNNPGEYKLEGNMKIKKQD